MKLLWVSRGQHDAAQEYAERMCDRLNEAIAAKQAAELDRALLQGALDRANKRYDELLDKFLQLRVTGAATPAEIRPVLPIQAPVSAIQKAFNIAMAGKPRSIVDAASAALELDMIAVETGFLTEDELVRRIRHGNETDGVPD